jgi:phosphocarrier protein
MAERILRVNVREGLCASPSGSISTLAGKFKSDITLEYREDRVNGKSIMGIITLGVACRARIKVIAIGEDEEEALDAIAAVDDKHYGRVFKPEINDPKIEQFKALIYEIGGDIDLIYSSKDTYDSGVLDMVQHNLKAANDIFVEIAGRDKRRNSAAHEQG